MTVERSKRRSYCLSLAFITKCFAKNLLLRKSKQTCLLAGQKHATFLFKLKLKFAKRATCKFFSALFLPLVGSGPKKSMPIEKLGSSSLVSCIF